MDKNNINTLKAAYNDNIKVAVNRMANIEIFNNRIIKVKGKVSNIAKLIYKNSYKFEILLILKKDNNSKRIKLL